VTKPPAANRNNSKLRPIMLQPTASKSNAAALRLSEELQATAASSHREYGATSFIAHHGDQPPDELSCATKDRKHIHRVFQVNSVVKYTKKTCCVEEEMSLTV